MPPISKNGQKSQFIPSSLAWNNMNLKICYLKEQYRHEDTDLVQVLNDIRENRAGSETLNFLRSKSGSQTVDPSDLTKLYTHNIDVDRINEQKLKSLPGQTHLYNMRASGFKPVVEGLKNSCLAPAELFLKKQAMVMFVKNNFEQGYVNGTLGRVVDFDDSGLPVIQTLDKKKIIAAPTSWVIEEEGKTKAEIVQLPLRLAWAITVHKSQGMSLDMAEIDLSKSFEKGMGYVALSRVRSLGGIKLRGINRLALEVNEEVLEFDKKLQEMSEGVALDIKKIDIREKEKRQKEFLHSIAPPEGKPKKRRRKVPGATYEETKAMFSKKMSIKQIANRRGLTQGTIVSHLEKLIDRGEELGLEHIKPPAKRFAKIERAFEESGDLSLSPVRAILGEDYSYDELRLARLFLKMGDL